MQENTVPASAGNHRTEMRVLVAKKFPLVKVPIYSQWHRTPHVHDMCIYTQQLYMKCILQWHAGGNLLDPRAERATAGGTGSGVLVTVTVSVTVTT